MAVKDQKITNDYALYNGDCVEVMKDMPENSIHMSIYSPPFGGLYNYSSDERDVSNSLDYNQFTEHYNYVISEICRITHPGRITAVHCTDIPMSNTGKDYLKDFPGDVIRLHEQNGFHFIARHTIWKEPLWVRNRTMTKNLAHKTVVEDSAYAGVASADYLLIFRKKGKNSIPIKNPNGLRYYAGECPLPEEAMEAKDRIFPDQKKNRYSHWIWRRYASSIWDDVRIGRVLPFVDCKEDDDEKHVHALQLDVIERAIVLRSNPDEIVLTPFMGVGSEVYGAVELGRKGVGVELKTSYYRQAVKNMENCKKGKFLKREDKKVRPIQ